MVVALAGSFSCWVPRELNVRTDYFHHRHYHGKSSATASEQSRRIANREADGGHRRLKRTSTTVLDTLGALVPRALREASPQHRWWPSWLPDERARRGTAAPWPSGIGSNS